MNHKLLVLMSFEVTTVTSMDSQEPPYKACFGSAKFNRGWDYKCTAV